MTQANELNQDDRLYLDDLRVGQRFSSKSHVLDEDQIQRAPRRIVIEM